MKDQLINDLEGLFHELVDYRSRLLHHLNDANVTEELSDDAIEDLRQIRMSLSYTEDRIMELKDQINKRVYCIQVTTTVDMNIKVLAKNEDDAIDWATQIADKRIDQNLESRFDCYYHSVGEMLGHESIEDDEAEEEYPYDE
jgi:hypothetical protein